MVFKKVKQSIGVLNESYKKELYIKDNIKRVTISDIKNWIPKINIDGYKLFKDTKEARKFGNRVYGKWGMELERYYTKQEILNSEANKLNPYKALNNYSNDSYEPINIYLRDGYSGIANYYINDDVNCINNNIKKINDNIKNIDIAFSDVPELDESIIVFRSIRLDEKLIDTYQSLKEGDILTEKGYMSTSLILDKAVRHGSFIKGDSALLVIKIPKGEKCISIDDIEWECEYEMLINKNRMLKVEKVLVKNDEQFVLLCELQR